MKTMTVTATLKKSTHFNHRSPAMRPPASRLIATLSFLPALSFAHDGHALAGSHWHGTDAWGFVALAVMVGAALWWSRGGR